MKSMKAKMDKKSSGDSRPSAKAVRETRSKKAPAKAAGSSKSSKKKDVGTSRDASRDAVKETAFPAEDPCVRCKTKDIVCMIPTMRDGSPATTCTACRQIKKPCRESEVKAARPVPQPKRSAEIMESVLMPPVKRQRSEEGGQDALIRALTAEISMLRRDVIAELAMSRNDARDRHAAMMAAQNRHLTPPGDVRRRRKESPLAGISTPEISVSMPEETSVPAISSRRAEKQREVVEEGDDDEEVPDDGAESGGAGQPMDDA